MKKQRHSKLIKMAVTAVFFCAAILFHVHAEAGTVFITNNFVHDIRVGIYAGVSESQVKVYKGEKRTYGSFISRSIEKIVVLNLDGGTNAQLGVHAVLHPSASTNFNVLVDGDGNVSVTEALLLVP